MSKIIRNSRVVSQTGYYKDLVSKPSINGHILEEIGNTSKNLDIFVTIPKAEYEDDAFEPNVQTLYAVIDEDENVRVHFFNQNPDAPVEYILHDYREVDELPETGDETVLYYVKKSYRDEDTETVYRMGLWGWVCIDPEEEEYKWRNFTDTKVDDLTIHNYESLSTQIGGYIKESFETEDVNIVNNIKPLDVETDGTNTTLHLGWSDYEPYTPNTKYSFKVRYQIGSEQPIIKEGEITPHGTLPTLRVQDVGTVVLQKPEITMVIDGTIFTTTDVENYRVTITWAKPKDTFVSRINPLFIPHDSTIKVNEEGKLSVGGNSNAYAAINKVGDYLYDTYYSGLDYGYAEQYFKNKNSTAGFCSLMRSGNLIGRNYDMVYSELCDFIVHTPNRTGRFATVGVASGLKELTRETVESGKNSDDYKILPFQLVDGMNEKGVFAAYNMVPTDKALTTLTVPDIMEKKVMCALQLVRFVVDNFETALEAVEYIRDYVGVYMTDELQDKGYELHLMVMDKDDSYIIEFIDNKNIVQNVAAGTYMTNFYQTDAIVNFDRTVYTPEDAPTHLPSADNNITEHGSGLERYNIMARAFNPIAPFTSKAEMWNLMDQLKYTNTYTGLTGSDPWGSEFVGIDDITVDTPIADIQASAGVQAAIDKFNNRSRDPEDPNYGTWHTMHSCVYDVVNTSISVASQEGSEEYTYELPKTSEEDNEIRLSEISDETIDTSQNATLQLILDGIFNENKTFIINYNDEEKILTNSTPMRDDHGVYLPFSGSPHGDYTLLRVYYDVPTKLVMGCKRYQMLPVMYSLMDIAEGSPLATNCLVAVCDDFRKITFSAPNPFKIGLKDGWKGDGTVQYSFNKQDWFDWDGITPIVAEQNVYDVYEVHFRGVDNTYLWQDDENYTAFCVDSVMNDVRVKGNVVYMLDYETDVPDTLDHIFQGLFSGGGIEEGAESGLYDATDLTLPFTSLGDYSYKYMFENCVNLINGPQIPAIEAKVESCMGMFKGCKSLEECPTLPATVLGNRCYAEMFMGCETITETPILAAQILKEECYMDMFNGCIALETCPVLPAVMFAVPKGAYKGMFQDCTGITTMPVLEATMLEESAYERMFNGCTALVNTPNKLPAMAMAKYCYKNMFTNCDSLVKMPQLPAKTMQPYCYQEMFSECDNLKELSTLPIDVTAEGCCQQMFLNCPEITKPLDLPSKILAKYCYKGMFQNCTGITWLPSGKVYKVPSIGKATSSQISAGWNTDMFKGTTVYCDESEAPIPIVANTYYYTTPEEYLTFDCMNVDGVTQIHSTLPTGDKSGNFCYSLDKVHWRPFVGGDVVSVDNRGVIYFCGRITDVKETYGLTSDRFAVGVSGNIKCMSSIPQEIWEVTQPDVNYAGLFNGMSKLCFAQSVVLIPEYTSDYMYQNLFKNTDIVHGPSIPVTANVAAHAYEGMFYNCARLCETPAMTFPETDIHEYAYKAMFYGCKDLPKVPADTLPGIIDKDVSPYCYAEMFYGCEKIKYCMEITDTFTAPHYCDSMYKNSGVESVAGSTWLPEVIETYAYNHMYDGTKVASIGDISTLGQVKAYGCYFMFANCNELKCNSLEDTIEINPEVGTLANYALARMFSHCGGTKAPIITFGKDTVQVDEKSVVGMYEYCDKLRILPKLYPTVLKTECYREMFRDCADIVWSRYGAPYRIPWETNATSTGTNVVLDIFKNTTALVPEDYGIPGSELNPSTPGTPELFKVYYYGDPAEWVTFTSDKVFTTHLTPQYIYYDEEASEWKPSTTARDVNAFNVDGTYILKVAGFHTTVSTKTGEERNDNPITMTGEGWVKAKGKISALIGHGLTNGSHIFMENTRLRDITELDLETPLADDDFNAAPTGFRLESLFQGCTGLVDSGVPVKFPLTVLAPYNCMYMFRGCTGLTKTFDFTDAASIPLVDHCFYGMYYDCTGITKAPKLPWTKGGRYGYGYMFRGCTALTSVEGIALTTAEYGCCYYMFQNCTNLVTVDTKLIKVTQFGTEKGYEFYGMFYGCSKFTTTMDLVSSISSSTTLTNYIFGNMFQGTAIVTPPYLPWTNLGVGCYYYMFNNCTAMTSYATGKSTDSNRYLPATTLKSYCYYGMYYNCSKLTSPWRYYIGGEDAHPYSSYFRRMLNWENATYCFGYMFAYTKITTAPQLELINAKTSETDRGKENPEGMCYYMFRGCSSLTNTGYIYLYSYASTGTTLYYLRHISNHMFRGMFMECTSLTSYGISWSYINYIGEYGAYAMYQSCTALNPRTSCTEFSNVTTVKKYGCGYMFYGCTALTRPLYWFRNLVAEPEIGDYACYYMYGSCGKIRFSNIGGKFYIYNGKIGTNALYGMFNGKGTTGWGGNAPDSNGTPSKGVTYYFADSPVNLYYYNSAQATFNHGSDYLYYSQDNGVTWSRTTSALTLYAGNTTWFYCHGSSMTNYTINQYSTASDSFTGRLGGYVAALALDFIYGNTDSASLLFYEKFKDSTGITDIYNLNFLTYTSRNTYPSNYQYGGYLRPKLVGYPAMFYNCTYLKTAPYEISYNIGYHDTSTYFDWCSTYGIFQAMFKYCYKLTQGPLYWRETKNSIESGSPNVGYRMFYETFAYCNNLANIQYISYSESTPINCNYQSQYIFYKTFYNCYVLKTNPIYYIQSESNGGDLPDYGFYGTFNNCYVLPKPIKFERKGSGWVYARTYTCYQTYYYARVANTIYLPYNYGDYCCHMMCYCANRHDDVRYDCGTQCCFSNATLGGYKYCYGSMFTSAAFKTYVAYAWLKAIKDTGSTLAPPSGTKAFTSVFSSMYGTGSGGVVSNTITMKGEWSDFSAMCKFDFYGTWAPLRNGTDKTPAVTASGITFTYSY